MGSKLYVGNLSFDTTDQELEQAFSAHGEVASALVVKDKYTDKSRGFGFVEFAQEADAKTAKESMNGQDLGGRALKVDEANPPRERSGNSGGNGGGYNSRERQW
jgi:RNA recognition motif-containing protein